MSIIEIQHFLKDRDINFDCPQCNYTFKVPFQTYISDGSKVACPCCERHVRIQHTNENRAFIKKVLALQIEI